MPSLRVGIIGLRFGAQAHAPAFARHPRCTLAAIAGRDPGKREEIANQLGIGKRFTDWREMIADPDIDLVSIAVPPAAQTDMIVAAAANGKHVFCEKPLSATLPDARRALAAVEAAAVVHGIDFLFPEITAWREARRLLTEGAIGPVRHFAYTWRVETYASRMKTDSWKNRPDEGGGALGNFVSHVYHNIEWLLGSIIRITASDRPPNASNQTVQLADGTAGTIAVCTDAFLGGGHTLEIYGETGTLVLANPGADYAAGFSLKIGTRSSPQLVAVKTEAVIAGVDGRIAPLGRLIDRLVSAIDGHGAMTPNLAHGVRVQELLQQAAATS
jgi:predicted dehydrogenase